MPWTGLENGATADEPRSNKVDDAILQTPSDWPIIMRFTQLRAWLSVSKSAVRSELAGEIAKLPEARLVVALIRKRASHR
jgi:hypothetical protein